MTFWPTTLDSQVCATLRTPVTIAMAIIPPTSTVRSSRSLIGDGGVQDPPEEERRDHPQARRDDDQQQNGRQAPLVRLER